MSLVSRKVGDKTLLKLIRQYLQSGMAEGGKTVPRRAGTPQGGPLSPLLSNILLNELECCRLPKAKKPGRMDTMPAQILYLESLEAAEAKAEGV